MQFFPYESLTDWSLKAESYCVWSATIVLLNSPYDCYWAVSTDGKVIEVACFFMKEVFTSTGTWVSMIEWLSIAVRLIFATMSRFFIKFIANF